MEIRLAKSMGYCFGVKRALELVEKALEQGPFPVWTLGPIIHNPVVVQSLEKRGVRCAASPEEPDRGTVVQRSHGTSLDELARISPNVRLVDATCPFVKRAQERAYEFRMQGVPVVVVGDRDHPEVRAILSHAGEKAFCIHGADEVPLVVSELDVPQVAIVAQTTCRKEQVEKVLDEFRKAGILVRSANTICTATQERQAATLELARECDLILVVGGRTSANTARLLEIARDSGREAYLVESADDLRPEWFRGKTRVGIAAGASTPDQVIKEVVGTVEEMEKANVPQNEPEETGLAHGAAAPEAGSQPDSAKDMYDESFKALSPGQIVPGRVVSVDENGALVDVGAKSEGIIPASELQRKGPFGAKPLSPGDEIMVYVVSADSGEGGLRLSKRRADEELAWQRLEQAYREGQVIEAPVVQEVKGGLVVDVGLRGFVPASQVERGYVNDLSKYMGKTLRMKVLELDRSKNRVVLSQRVVLEEEHQRKCEETWSTIAVGQVRRGIVKGITDFGVFVDLGGVDGLLHISELSYGRVRHPSEVVREGEEIEVKVLKVDREKGKISLGRKQVLPDPWAGAEQKYPVGAVVPGEVTRTAPFGAFVQLEPGVEGLVHISEISDKHVAKPEDEVKAGDHVMVKVLRVLENEKRISLSIKQADQSLLPERSESQKAPNAEN